jgi:cell division GTPase FtsZ|tara:strand:+ start:361 stop:735 length:375 start_codon:yes stop_codon:yes gene_type:complete
MALITTVISVFPIKAYEKATAGGVGSCPLDKELVAHGCETKIRKKISKGIYEISAECDMECFDVSKIAEVMHKHGFTYMSVKNALSKTYQSITAKRALEWEREEEKENEKERKTTRALEERAEA